MVVDCDDETNLSLGKTRLSTHQFSGTLEKNDKTATIATGQFT